MDRPTKPGMLDEFGVYRIERHRPAAGGVINNREWLDNRCRDLLEAIEVKRRLHQMIPAVWVTELADHLEWLQANPA